MENTNDKIRIAAHSFGIDWYKVIEKASGINESLTDICNSLETDLKQEHFLVKRHHPSNGMYWGVATQPQIEKMIKKNTYLYEILSPTKPKKVYFDIDSSVDSLEDCKTILLNTFPNCNLQISGYKSPEKYSFHIILSNYFTTDTTVLKKFCADNVVLGFDPLVYNNYNLFKCINQSKPKIHSKIQAYLEGSTELSKHLVLIDFDDNAININTIESLETTVDNLRNSSYREKINKIDLLNINPLDVKNEVPDDFDYINAMAIDKLNVIPNAKRHSIGVLDHNIIWKVMVWACNEDIKFDDFWKWCMLKDSCEKRYVRYLDYYAVARKYNVAETFIDTLLLKFYPFLGQDKSKDQYRINNTLNHTHIITKNYMDHTDIGSVKYSFLDIKMGGNKTGAILDYIKLNKDSSVLYISPRIALSQDLMGRMDDDMNFELYSNVLKKKDLVLYDRLIMSINSIHYLAGKYFDIVIIDEIESVWDSFKGEANTHQKHLNSNWYVFLECLKNSKKVIVMDALMTNKTLKTINSIEPLIDNFELLTLESKQEPRQILKVPPHNIELWFKSIIKSIQDGEKVFIFMPYKVVYQNTNRHQWAGIKQLVGMICNVCNLEEDVDVIGYHAEAKTQKQDLVHINKIWKNARVIVANTCISVGVNYSGNDFNKIYAYFSNWLNTRDFAQVLYRIRNPINKVMICYYERAYRLSDYVLNKGVLVDCNAFKILRQEHINESKADALTRLDVISNRCNISTITKDKDLKNLKDKRFDISYDFTLSYDDIPDMTEKQFKSVKSRLETGFNTLNEKLMYEKYLLKKTFVEDTPKDVLQFFWVRFEAPLHNLKVVLQDANHIINVIFQNLKYTGGILEFFDCLTKPIIISTLSMPKSISNNLLKEHFHFKHEIQSRNTELFKRILNGFFGFNVISREYIDKIPQKVWDASTNKYINKWIINPDFLQAVQYYKDYSVAYFNTQQCQIPDDDDNRDLWELVL